MNVWPPSGRTDPKPPPQPPAPAGPKNRLAPSLLASNPSQQVESDSPSFGNPSRFSQTRSRSSWLAEAALEFLRTGPPAAAHCGSTPRSSAAKSPRTTPDYQTGLQSFRRAYRKTAPRSRSAPTPPRWPHRLVINQLEFGSACWPDAYGEFISPCHMGVVPVPDIRTSD